MEPERNPLPRPIARAPRREPTVSLSREAAIATGRLATNTQTRRTSLTTNRLSPVRYTRAKADAVLARLRAGFVLTTAVAEPDTPCLGTIMRWFREDVDGFTARYKEAQQDRLVRWAEEIIQIADDVSQDFISVYDEEGKERRVFNIGNIHRAKLRIESRRWMLERLDPERFGSNKTTNVSVSTNTTVNATVPTIIINPVSSRPVTIDA